MRKEALPWKACYSLCNRSIRQLETNELAYVVVTVLVVFVVVLLVIVVVVIIVSLVLVLLLIRD